jgi:CHAT domain-containing protein
MARKWHLFLHRFQSFLKSHGLNLDLLAITRGKRNRFVRQVLLMLLFLGISILPVTAQTPSGTSTAQVAESANAFVKQARGYYDKGEYDKAINPLMQAEESYKKVGDLLNQAMVLSNLSLAYQQMQDLENANRSIATSLKLLQSMPASQEQYKLLASALEIQGKLQLAQGQPDQALETWKAATKEFYKANDKKGKIRTKIHQSIALQELGLYREAFQVLMELREKILLFQQDTVLKANLFQSLGNVIRIAGLLDETEQLKPFLKLLPDPKLDKNLNYLERSRQFLLESLHILEGFSFKFDVSEAYLSLGNTERAAYYRAKDAYDRVVSTANDPNQQLRLLRAAITCYRKASGDITPKTLSPIPRIQAQLNHLSLLIDLKKQLKDAEAKLTNEYNPNQKDLTKMLRTEVDSSAKELNELVAQLSQDIILLPASRPVIYAQIYLAQNLIRLYAPDTPKDFPEAGFVPKDFPEAAFIHNLLTEAEKNATEINDQRAKAHAQGSLGSLYEKTGNQQAQHLTEQALKLAELIQAPDVVYQLQWQLGRIMIEQARNPGKTQQQKMRGAIAAYKEATKTLNILRQDLSALNPDLPFLFRDTVEPVYRELVWLLLPSKTTLVNSDTSFLVGRNNLEDAIQFFEDLQVLELENFLRCRLQDAVNVTTNQNDKQEDTDTAFIYPILLPGRLEVLLKLPNQDQPIRRTTYGISELKIKAEINQLRTAIKDGDSALNQEDKFKRLYDLLFRQEGQQDTTIEVLLQEKNIKTLVFVLDSALRNIPIAALYDGKEYLVQKPYSVALNLVPQRVKTNPLQKQGLKILAAGISVENPYPELLEGEDPPSALPGVIPELMVIRSIPGSQILCNDGFDPLSQFKCDGEFSLEKLEETIKSQSFRAIHLATHGTFSSSPDSTFILAYQKQIGINQLSEVLRSRQEKRPEPIELLVFSACDTANGDERAILGMAGISVRVGARSAIGTQFFATDQPTASLMGEFYKKLLEPDVTISEALRHAQKSLLVKGSPPSEWATYVLVGNWR